MVCRKKTYPRWEDAQLELCKILQRGIRGPGDKLEQRAYRCRYCRGFHLTSQEKRRRL